MQRLFPLVICWLICRHAHTIDYIIVQTPDPFPQFFSSRTSWNSQNFWTMNTQNLSTLQVFQSFSHKCKNLFLQSCPKDFAQFLCEWILNLLNGNVHSIKRQHVANFQNGVRPLSLKRTTWKQRRDILASERGLQLIKVITPPAFNHLFWYRAVCPHSCVFVKQSLISQSVTKQELPKYQPSQDPSYQIDSLRRERIKKIFFKADSLVDNILSCPRIKLSNSQTLV